VHTETDTARDRAREAVKARMTAVGFGPTELARITQISRNALSDFISGNAWPRAKTQRLIESALRMPPGEISRLGRPDQGSSQSVTDRTHAVISLDRTITAGLDEVAVAEIEAVATAAALARAREIRGRSRR
jgi:transcriptional regulator with XRE-family HTH domain